MDLLTEIILFFCCIINDHRLCILPNTLFRMTIVHIIPHFMQKQFKISFVCPSMQEPFFHLHAAGIKRIKIIVIQIQHLFHRRNIEVAVLLRLTIAGKYFTAPPSADHKGILDHCAWCFRIWDLCKQFFQICIRIDGWILLIQFTHHCHRSIGPIMLNDRQALHQPDTIFSFLIHCLIHSIDSFCCFLCCMPLSIFCRTIDQI